jgi:hypothetical protein
MRDFDYALLAKKLAVLFSSDKVENQAGERLSEEVNGRERDEQIAQPAQAKEQRFLS